MTDDERVLRSFVEGEEDLVGIWGVTSVKNGKGLLPPTLTEVRERVGVTDERILWFQDELSAVPLEGISDVEREHVERQAAPPIVLAGGLAFIVGIFATIGAFLANVGDTIVVAMPVLTGLLVLVATNLFARTTGREGESREGHRLRFKYGDDEFISIWGPADALAELETALRGEAVSFEASDDAADDGSTADAVEDVVADADGSDDGADAEGDVADAAASGNEADAPGEGVGAESTSDEETADVTSGDQTTDTTSDDGGTDKTSDDGASDDGDADGTSDDGDESQG